MVQGIIISTALTSVVLGALYVWDKRAAANGNNRVPEQQLLIWAALGGWPGACVVGRLIRHKTQKRSYRLAFGICVLLNILLITGLFLIIGG